MLYRQDEGFFSNIEEINHLRIMSNVKPEKPEVKKKHASTQNPAHQCLCSFIHNSQNLEAAKMLFNK